MREYTKYSLDGLIALHTAKDNKIKKFQRRPQHHESELKLLKSEKECLKRLIEAQGGKTRAMERDAVAQERSQGEKPSSAEDSRSTSSSVVFLNPKRPMSESSEPLARVAGGGPGI